jgi:hypothetical protein
MDKVCGRNFGESWAGAPSPRISTVSLIRYTSTISSSLQRQILASPSIGLHLAQIGMSRTPNPPSYRFIIPVTRKAACVPRVKIIDNVLPRKHFCFFLLEVARNDSTTFDPFYLFSFPIFSTTLKKNSSRSATSPIYERSEY